MTGKLTDLFIRTDFKNSKMLASFTAPHGCRSCKWEVLDGADTAATGTLAINSGDAAYIEAVIMNFKPWNIDTPYLYILRLELDMEDGKTVLEEKFGMREIRTEGSDIYVNDEKFFARGYIRGREAHDHPNLENLPLVEYYEKNIRAAKDYGFNLIRFHSRIPPEECFEAADRLGIFIHVEIRKYYGKYQKERAMMTDTGEIIDENEWCNVVKSLRNHPSLMVYCMGNEIRFPGKNPFVEHIANVTKKLDPTRLFIDTCAHGEFDRTYVDFDVQHMTYYYPFGSTYDMFENTQNWLIYGSCKGLPLVEEAENCRVTRAIPSKRPVLAHEICHYTALRDLDALEKKFEKYGAEKPWWIGELKKLIKEKNLEKDYKKMMKASRFFQMLSWKLGIEAARRSSLLSGFHFLQLSDTDRYENSNGIIDCFDDKTGVDEREFLKFNGDCVILTDLPRRTYFEGEKVTIPVLLSHFSPYIKGWADFRFKVMDKSEKKALVSGGLNRINLDEKGRREICRIELSMPESEKPRALELICSIRDAEGKFAIENNWNIWLYPDRPQKLPHLLCTVACDEVGISKRYPQIESRGSADEPEKLLIANRFSAGVLKHLENGGDVLMLYRVPETRDRKVRAQKEEYYLPATWDRLKGVIWDRGTNHGAFLRESKAFDLFPNEGFMDLQFHGLIDDCDKIVLDDFPCPVDPLMQGVDKASRDRYDVYTFGLSELQPGWTMRKFAYVFELKVGKGRLLVTGFNFTGLNSGKPEVCAMFESLMSYVLSDSFSPKDEITVKALEQYLLKKGAEPRVKERMMTQFWQLNEEPLESEKYWRESEEYIREG